MAAAELAANGLGQAGKLIADRLIAERCWDGLPHGTRRRPAAST
jgi:hypothetical protein